MHTWKLKNAQHRLRELVRLALTKEPQRLSNGKDAVVVIAASEYDRLVAAAPPKPAEQVRAHPKAAEPRAAQAGERQSAWDDIEEFRSKHDMEEVGWLLEWDWEKREWYLPEEHALSS
ncbi:MAG TPA: hypothetical protein VEY93_01585 [Longimicrobium sp.]|nr:hypothetical protein [Longimicrobium sp.]